MWLVQLTGASIAQCRAGTVQETDTGKRSVWLPLVRRNTTRPKTACVCRCSGLLLVAAEPRNG